MYLLNLLEEFFQFQVVLHMVTCPARQHQIPDPVVPSLGQWSFVWYGHILPADWIPTDHAPSITHIINPSFLFVTEFSSCNHAFASILCRPDSSSHRSSDIMGMLYSGTATFPSSVLTGFTSSSCMTITNLWSFILFSLSPALMQSCLLLAQNLLKLAAGLQPDAIYCNQSDNDV